MRFCHCEETVLHCFLAFCASSDSFCHRPVFEEFLFYQILLEVRNGVPSRIQAYLFTVLHNKSNATLPDKGLEGFLEIPLTDRGFLNLDMPQTHREHSIYLCVPHCLHGEEPTQTHGACDAFCTVSNKVLRF